MDKHSCTQCGLLGIRPRDRHELHNYQSVSPRDMEKYLSAPVCAVGQQDFFQDGIQRRWECPDFIRHHPGLQPKDHLEMGLLVENTEAVRELARAFAQFSTETKVWREKCCAATGGDTESSGDAITPQRLESLETRLREAIERTKKLDQRLEMLERAVQSGKKQPR